MINYKRGEAINVPGWIIHNKWVLRMGISKEVSEYINRAIDNVSMPEDFREYIEKRRIPRSRGGNISIMDAVSLQGRSLHDLGRGDKEKVKFIKEPILLFLSRKGKDYVKVWYLHFILDYLNSKQLRDWMKNTGESIEDCINKYQKNKAVTVSGTEEQLIEVMDFLKRNTQELQEDLNLPK